MKVETGVSPAVRVKIVKCNNVNYWYADKIGSIFAVEKELFHKDQWYKVYSEYWEGSRLIEVADAVLVSVQPNNKYSREIKPGVFVDVYDVLRAFNVTDPCLQHLLKKALAAGCRGHKNTEEDLQDILASAQRAVEMYSEWKEHETTTT